MTYGANNTITVGDTRNRINTNYVNNIIANNYHNGNVPRYSGPYGTFNAIPTGDLDSYASAQASNNTANSMGSSGSIISMSALYNALNTIGQNLSRIRYFTSTLKAGANNNGGGVTYYDAATISGRAIFRTSLPGISSGYTRDRNGNLVVNPGVGDMLTGKVISTSLLDQVLQQFTNAQNSAANVRITYTYTSCHTNCHNSCHDNRGRR